MPVDRLPVHELSAVNGHCLRFNYRATLAFGDQLLDGTSHIFDRHFRINAVPVEDVDTIGPQTI